MLSSLSEFRWKSNLRSPNLRSKNSNYRSFNISHYSVVVTLQYLNLTALKNIFCFHFINFQSV